MQSKMKLQTNLVGIHGEADISAMWRDNYDTVLTVYVAQLYTDTASLMWGLQHMFEIR